MSPWFFLLQKSSKREKWVCMYVSLSRNGQRQGFMIDWLRTAAPSPQRKSPLASQVKMSFLQFLFFASLGPKFNLSRNDCILLLNLSCHMTLVCNFPVRHGGALFSYIFPCNITLYTRNTTICETLGTFCFKFSIFNINHFIVFPIFYFFRQDWVGWVVIFEGEDQEGGSQKNSVWGIWKHFNVLKISSAPPTVLQYT